MFFCVLRSLGFVGWAPKMAVVEGKCCSILFLRTKNAERHLTKALKMSGNLRKTTEPRQKPAIVSIVDSADQRFSFFWTGPATNQRQSSSDEHQQVGFPKDQHLSPIPILNVDVASYWLVVSNIWILFHFIYGMSSFPLTNSYFSRWLPSGELT